ncbi:7TM diverse intracellular signaling domain-containing protein [Gemmobacter lanyuensis]
MAANVTAKPRLLAQRTSLITDLVQIAYFSVMLVLFVWALRMRLITKERVFLCFAAMQGLWLLHNFIYFGYIKALAPGIPHESLMLVFRSLVISAAILSVYFHRTVLARFKPNPVFLRLFDVQIIVMLGAAVVYFIANRWVGLQINAYCIAASPFVFLLNVFRPAPMPRRGYTSRGSSTAPFRPPCCSGCFRFSGSCRSRSSRFMAS